MKKLVTTLAGIALALSLSGCVVDPYGVAVYDDYSYYPVYDYYPYYTTGSVY